MAKGKNKLSCTEAVTKVLTDADSPLSVKEVAERVLALPNHGVGGKTPEATIGANLYVGAKNGRYAKLAKTAKQPVRFRIKQPAAA